jgi:hypothetical protein
MRIAYLNPWKHAAENQAFRSLQQAATRIGHELIHCADSDEVEVQQPDFVLATASTQAKLNDCPHYGTIHEPRDRFLTSREYFNNLLSYDGYLTISETIERFLRNVLFNVGRDDSVGFYYNTCQRQELVTDLPTLIRDRKLIVTYFGTNWDHRRSDFFRRFSELDGVQICGPAHSWPHINKKAYGGAPAFDGNAVQMRYAANGIGLCLLSELHLRDDIVSNRLFEVTSVGAIAICCDTPWIRRHFGDSVYYVDQTLPDEAFVDAIKRCVDEIYADPAAAVRRARDARRIFETTFTAEALLANAVTYHEEVSAARTAAITEARQTYQPFVSVIMRCGGRPISAVNTALRTVLAQTYGRFEVVFVRYRDIDLTPLLQLRAPNLHSMRVVDCPGGGRSATLWAGLAAISGDYFSILDDDDWLFSNHFERLFTPFPTRRLDRFMAFSGSIAEGLETQPIMGGGAERRAVFKFGIDETPDACGISAAFASNCFVASSDLLHPELLTDPGMSTAEDTYLILSLMAQTTPRFSYAATSGHLRGDASQSDFLAHPSRFEDLLTLRTRLQYNLPMVSADKWKELETFWRQRPAWRRHELVSGERQSGSRPRPRIDLMANLAAGQCVATGYVASGARFSRWSSAEDPKLGSAFVNCAASAASDGAELPLPVTGALDGEHVFATELIVDRGAVDVVVLDAARREIQRKTLVAGWGIQQVLLRVEDEGIGSLVVQNSARGESSVARVVSMRLYGHRDSE